MAKNKSVPFFSFSQGIAYCYALQALDPFVIDVLDDAEGDDIFSEKVEVNSIDLRLAV